MPPTASALNAFALLQKYHPPDSKRYRLLLTHSVLVAAKALEIATAYLKKNPGRTLDLAFLEEAALLHDIGVFRCYAPKIFCFGNEPYIRHGVAGREILEKEGWPRHALACERHTGTGITLAEVVEQKLPLPARDYLPSSLEEKILCLADRFYVKEPGRLYTALSIAEIGLKIAGHGEAALARWQELRRMFLA